jgi:hypothetical protein
MLRVKIDGEKLNTKERRDKANLIEDEMQLIVNHPRFKELFMQMDYHGELSLWRKATITEIWNYFINGAEVLDPELDNEIDIYVDDYYKPTRTIGHTYPSDPYIYTNTKYFDHTSSKNSGSNFLHEYGHKKGFSHDYKDTPRRDFSLCYQLNEVYEQVWEELFGDPSERDLVQVCYRSWKTFWFKRCYWKKSNAVEIPV